MLRVITAMTKAIGSKLSGMVDMVVGLVCGRVGSVGFEWARAVVIGADVILSFWYEDGRTACSGWRQSLFLRWVSREVGK